MGLMLNKSKTIFKPSKLRTLLGLVVHVFILNSVVEVFTIITLNNFLSTPLPWISLGAMFIAVGLAQLFVTLVLFAPWYSYNSITVLEKHIEGPTMYGMFWKKTRIPIKNVILKDAGNDFLYSRILLGHVLTSVDGHKINILWLEKNKIDELLALVKAKANPDNEQHAIKA